MRVYSVSRGGRGLKSRVSGGIDGLFAGPTQIAVANSFPAFIARAWMRNRLVCLLSTDDWAEY